MLLPTRTFNGTEGQASTGNAGPDAIETDIDNIIDFLTVLKTSVTDSDSGADNISLTAISGLTGLTVQTVLESIKTILDTKETTTGAQAKADAVQTNLTTHLADLITDADGVHGLRIEEGSFTPTVTFGGLSAGITYASRVGTYKKIGKVVYYTMNFTLSNKGSSAGMFAITGLPFASASSGTHSSTVGLISYVTFPANCKYITAYISPSASALTVRGVIDATSVATIYDTTFANNTGFYITGIYFTD